MTEPNFPNVQNVSNDDNLKWKMTSNGRQPLIAKFEYLSNHWSDLPQTLNLGLYDQARSLHVQNVSNEDNLKGR